VQFHDFMDRAYARSSRRWRWPIYRALKKYGVNVGRGWWLPNDELLARIRGEPRHSDSDLQQIMDTDPAL
jgi:hypothetical protein